MTKLMDFQETMAYLKISRATFYRLVQRKEIPSIRIGGRWRIDKERLDKWLREKEVTEDKASRSDITEKDKSSQAEKKELLTRSEIASYLKLSKQGIYKLVQTRQLPAVKREGKWLFNKKEIDEWLSRKIQS